MWRRRDGGAVDRRLLGLLASAALCVPLWLLLWVLPRPDVSPAPLLLTGVAVSLLALVLARRRARDPEQPAAPLAAAFVLGSVPAVWLLLGGLLHPALGLGLALLSVALAWRWLRGLPL